MVLTRLADTAGNDEFVSERVMDEVSVDLANCKNEASDQGRDCMEEHQSFFPELQDHHFERKFISLAEMQDTYLSLKEKTKRDHALKM
ncbi:hypothetical protein V6N13_005714 [Hibiscus sabdariffa]